MKKREQEPTQPREHTQAFCALCDIDYVYGDIMSGVTVDGVEYLGHYECVVKAMGPERTLEAIQSGQLPTRQVIEASRVKSPQPAAKLLTGLPRPASAG